MTELEVFKKRVEGHTVEGTPRTVEVPSCFGLLSAVVIVHKLVEN